ncbi:autophagy-related protein 16 isoform X2 [Musca domestica]|uniref:Autophagy-related protein 16 isoform X2 n=1 Tax=Musca domestica TaxID=7370 RepID=A0A9J7D1L4_MUSDO|nr:autophagy-related protein 16 isoform X2 [Musca domestica]
MAQEDQEYRQTIINRLRERNRRDVLPFKEIIQQNNRLLDSVAQLKADNLKISVENEQLRTAISTGGGGGKDSTAAQLAIAALEKKLLAQQEELTALHKRKGENSQLIVDLNLKMEKQQQIIASKEQSLAEQKNTNASLKAEVQMLKSSLEELKNLNTTLRDEYTALQLAFSALEDKLRNVQDENRRLLDRLMHYKAKDADKLNEENESFIRKRLPSIFRKRSDKLKRELEDAVREPNSSFTHHRNSSGSSIHGGAGGDAYDDSDRDTLSGDHNIETGCDAEMYGSPQDPFHTGGMGSYMKSANPTNIYMKFEAHETESHAVRWSPIERVIATGGADRKVKLWDVGKGSSEPRSVLGGSSAGINSVDFDSTGTYIIGTSNDYGARVWTVGDNRLRHTLTGHSGKVMAAKYIQEPVKVVTGSHDRTLKIWDLRSIACIETKFAGSSCNDLVTTDSLGSTIISGHYDKKIRFWDIRTEKQADDILMNAKITSLDLSKDCNYLICSVRDDTIKLLDLRKNQVISTFSNEHFKLSCDWARASFNMNATKIACGSSDGVIYIWNVMGNLECELKGHASGSGLFHSSAVNAVSWSPNFNALASVGKGKKCLIYTES